MIEVYIKIAERAEWLGITNRSRVTILLDLESADKQYALRLNDFLSANDNEFTHDFCGIANHIDRSVYPAKFDDCFTPRFAKY